MKTFTIDVDDNITVFDAGEAVRTPARGTERFRSERELATLAAKWPASRLVEIWNSLPGVQPVKRFTDHNTAVRRIWRAIQGLQPLAANTADTQPGQNANRRTVAHRERERSKAAQVIALLEAPGGATLKTIMAATGWQAHSVRGLISGHLGKKLGLRIKSFKRDGQRVYAIGKKTNAR